jgi:23S rRNA (cytidine2498-2'-O)-methyltransferase
MSVTPLDSATPSMESSPAPQLSHHHLFLTEEGSTVLLAAELEAIGAHVITQGEQWLTTGLTLTEGVSPLLAFGRQCMPHATEVTEAAISGWARRITDAAITHLPHTQPWRLMITPAYGQGVAGQQRCKLIGEAVREQLQKKRRSLVKSWQDSTMPFTADCSAIQVVLLSREQGYLSIAPAPLPFAQRQIVWPQSAGLVPVAADKAAPSRAFAKLVEAEIRMGQRILPGHSVVDLGAAPGSWSYVALQRGARVTAVDRSPLRDDLMAQRTLSFVQGDAFRYRPERAVDWLICDVIAEPDKLSDLLIAWLKEGLCLRFVFTIKFKGDGSYHQLQKLKAELPALCESAYLTRLCANKNEVTAFGVARRPAPVNG